MSRRAVVLGVLLLVAMGGAIWVRVWPETALDWLSGSDRVPGTLALPRERAVVFEVAPEDYGGVAELKGAEGFPLVLLPKRTVFDTGRKTTRRDHGYIGAKACAECHDDRWKTYRQTAHFLTSTPGEPAYIRGALEEEGRVLHTGNLGLWFETDGRPDGVYQSVVLEREGDRYSHSERIDIVVGSGKTGQSYLHWLDDQLHQMHVSYFQPTAGWINSPGPNYLDGHADFARPVAARCLECHATYFQPMARSINRYDPSNYVLGVGCERCHGPGAEHAAFHRANPDETEPGHIVNPGDLPPERSLDICAQCHSGSGQSIQPAFSFRPGNVIGDHIRIEHLPDPVMGGVHSDDQIARLEMSACFRMSEAMTCVTCHNPHRLERGNLALFSRRCARCHERVRGAVHERLGAAAANCIDCHMPRREEMRTPIAMERSVTFPTLRDHHIAVWPRATDQFLEDVRRDGAPPAGERAGSIRTEGRGGVQMRRSARLD